MIDPVQSEKSDQEIENELAAKFGGSKEKIEVEDPPKPTAKGQSEAEEEEPEGQPASEAEDPEAEEFEFEGKTYKAPKELKEAVMRTSDYTQKTMAAAEERKLLQQERETLKIESEFRTKHADALSDYRALESTLKQFETVDWNTLATQDHGRYLLLERQERQLQTQLQRKAGELQGIAAEFQREMQTQREKKLVAGRQMLRNEFKDEPADLGDRMLKTGQEYGFTKEELELLDDPRQARVLRDAMKWRELKASKPNVQKRAEQAPPIKVATARSTQSTQSAAQIDKLRDTVKKTGSSQAAEDLFTKLLSRKR